MTDQYGIIYIVNLNDKETAYSETNQNKDLLTELGECIGEMMLAKIMILSDYREE